MAELILFTTAAFFFVLSVCMLRRAGRVKRRVLRWAIHAAGAGSVVLALLLVAAGGVLTWYNHRPRLAGATRALFQGVTYIRDVRDTPRPLVIHIVEIDLREKGIGFLVTPCDPGADVRMPARTTGRFLEEFGVQIAVNGDCLDPFRANSVMDYYPHEGDPVRVLGNAASGGLFYATGRREDLTLYLTADNRARIGDPFDDTFNAISGTHAILRNGAVPSGLPTTIHPRTAVALDESVERMFLVVVDGRQPGYSEGVSLVELGRIIFEYGGVDALNLDGGGSSAMAVARRSGRARTLNWPVHLGIPGIQRPVANHLGVFAIPLRDKAE